MPTNTQNNNSLTLKFGSTVADCQVIDLSFKLPGVGASTVTQVACPGGVVAEPGEVVTGTLTGTTFTDTTDTGVTKVLMDAQRTDAQLTYELVIFADLGPTKAVKFSGNIRVASFQFDWTKPAVSRHALDLEVLTATFSRPTSTRKAPEAA